MAIYKSIFNEAYFGKSKELLEIENQIGIIRRKFSGGTYFGDWNGDPDVLRLNRLFEKAFNIYCFSTLIERGASYNAFTIPIAFNWDTLQFINPTRIKKMTIVDEKGMKFKNENKFAIECHIYSGLLFDSDLSDGEITGIILHEIGHNFAEALDNKIAVNSMLFCSFETVLQIINIILNKTINVKAAVSSLTRFNFLNKFMADLRENIYNSDLKVFVTISHTFDGIIALINDGILNLATLMSAFPNAAIAQIPVRVIQGLTKMVFKPTAYRNEKIADRFATMHGYGPELTSALSKMQLSANGMQFKQAIVDASPFLGYALNLFPTLVSCLCSPFDEHPIWAERLEDQIRALEYELKKSDYDPKMKKEIKVQLDQIRNLKNSIIKQSSNLGTEDAYALKKAWFATFSNGDIRHKLMLGDLDSDLDSRISDLKQESFTIFDDIAFI